MAPQPGAGTPPEPAGTWDFQAASSNGTCDADSPTGTATAMGTYVVGASTAIAGEAALAGRFNLFAAMQLFYANGGGDCFVISVANYWGGDGAAPTPEKPPVRVDKDDLLAGLAVANDTVGGTMLVVPDACLLVNAPAAEGGPYTYPDYQPVAVEMLRQAGTLRDRVAILDMPGALLPANWSPEAMQAEAEAFYTAIAPALPWFSYGVAYGPAVETSLLSASDLGYAALKGSEAGTALMNNLLTTQALELYPPAFDPGSSPGQPVYGSAFVQIAAHIAAAFPVAGSAPVASTPAGVTGTIGTPPLQLSLPQASVPAPADGDSAAAEALDRYLLNALPLLGQILQVLAGKLNVAPPSGIMAGVWAGNDDNYGVWNAPANVSLNEVIAPKVVLTDAQQADYNLPLNGNAIDILRAMAGRGTVVWGARTLDGNSPDYRYVQVRRTLVYVEQSIKLALNQFVFAPNDGRTWTTVTATVSSFLTQLWQAGGLAGGKASDAFTVQCGVGTTMTALDVLNGYMIVNVTLQMIHPAEFIELTFTQIMQGA